MTLSTFKEDYQQAMDVSKQIRKNSEKSIYPTSFYIESLNEVKKELDHSIQFLQEASENPALLFSQAKERWHSPQDILYKCLDYKGRETSQGTVHEFQAFLALKMDEVFQSWLKERAIEKRLKIEVRNPNVFPSIFAIFQDSKEMFQFNIFEKTYGMRTKLEPEEKILQAGQREEIRLKEDIKQEQERLDKLLKLQQNPFSKSLFSFRELYYLIFHHRRTMERINRLILEQKDRIHRIEEKIQGNREQLPFVLQDNQERREIFALIEPFFLQYDYQIEENQAKLY